MSISPEVYRSRTIRECILRLLNAAYMGNADIGVAYEQILRGFATGLTRYTPGEIQSEVIDLLRDGQIEDVRDPRGLADPLPDKAYRITSKGRDFCRARFPWDRLDEYTGTQSLT